MEKKKIKVLVNNKTRNYRVYRTNVSYFLVDLLKELKIEYGVLLSVAFVGTITIKKLNSLYRKHNKATNILSFSYGNRQKKEKFFEIIICPDVAFGEARKSQNSPNDYTSFLLIHGLLHCLGYDHESQNDRIRMERLEEKLFKKITVRKLIIREVN